MLKKSTSEEAVIANAMPVLRIFKNSLHKRLRLADIEKRIMLSHQTVFRKVKLLENNGILTRTENYYAPNFGNALVYKILELLAAKERDEFFKKYPRLKEPFEQLINFALNNRNILYIVLFGSYATGKARKTSDIDVFIAIKEDIKATAKELDNLFAQIEGGYLLNKYGFSPICAAPKDVKEMIKERKKFIQTIIEEGIIIYGEKDYFMDITRNLSDWFSWK